MFTITQVLKNAYFRISVHSYCVPFCSLGLNSRRHQSTETLPHPTPPAFGKIYPTKIKNIVDEISKLTLVEVADLNELLKKTLNIQDAPMMAVGALTPAAAAAEEGEESAPKKVKTSFTIKLSKYEDSKKVALIKEIKNIIEGMNLVQAKKFVESSPQVVKADISKDEAEKMKQALEAAGGTCEIE